MSWFRFFLRQWRRYGVATAWHNLRFEVGYAVGGFTHAWTYEPHELTFCSTCGEDVPRERH